MVGHTGAQHGKSVDRRSWTVITLGTAISAFVLANVVGGLDNIVSFIGATCGVALTFLVPASLALKMLPMTMPERAGHIVVMVLGTGLVGLGSYSSISGLVKEYTSGEITAFPC